MILETLKARCGESLALIFLIALLLLLLAIPADAKQKQDIRGFAWLYEPYYAEGDDALQRAMKIIQPIVGILDAHSTAYCLERGYREINPLVNLIIPKDEPAFGKRTALMLGTHYVAGLLLDWSDRKTGNNAKLKPLNMFFKGIRAGIIGSGIAMTVRNYQSSRR